LVACLFAHAKFPFTTGVAFFIPSPLRLPSVLEAAGLGLRRVREQEMLDDDLGFSDVTVEVATKTVHVVPINKLIEWRDSNSPSPRELNRKINVRGR
jgi:hypothetical protein